MRLDSRSCDDGWTVLDVMGCTEVPLCVWADDITAQYATVPSDLRERMRYFVIGDIGPEVHQERRIVILPAQHLVLIDPIGDPELDAVWIEVDEAEHRCHASLEAAGDAFRRFSEELNRQSTSRSDPQT
jgi:hypothetical protein